MNNPIHWLKQKLSRQADTAQDPLEQSRADARVLLWFAAREGTKVGDDVLNAIVDADSKLKDKKSRSPKFERCFWPAYRQLAAAVQPASIESILSTCRHPFGTHGQSGKWRLGNARHTKRLYAGSAVGVLIVLLVVQTYWFVLTTFSATLEKHRDELDSIAGSLRLVRVLTESLATLPSDSKTQPSDNDTQLRNLVKDNVDRALAERPALATIIETMNPKQQLLSISFLELEDKSYRRQRLVAMLKNEEAVLQKPWMIALYLWQTPSTNNDGRSHTTPTIYSNNAGVVEMNDDLVAKTAWNLRKKVDDEQMQINNIITGDVLERGLAKAKSIPTILSQYFLPMLYGLLGALTYILRDIAKEIHDVTFTRGSETRYSLRWPLGMLAGVTVGLFFDPTRFAGLAAITPLGVAFLAGYGVELFFTGLDVLVRAFTRTEPK